jgi:hypothetical protein
MIKYLLPRADDPIGHRLGTYIASWHSNFSTFLYNSHTALHVLDDLVQSIYARSFCLHEGIASLMIRIGNPHSSQTQ